MASAAYRKWHRLLSAVLVVVMLLSLLPTTLAAEQEEPKQETAGYVVLVSDQETEKGISGAVVQYTVLVNGEPLGDAASVETDADGKAAVAELADCAEALEAGQTVALEYAVSAKGYAPVEKQTQTIESVDGELAVRLVSSTATLSLKQEGSGDVKVNGSSSFPMQVNRGESAGIEITPAAGSFIQSVKIDGAVQTVEDRASFKTEYTFSADSRIEVVFGKYCKVHASITNGQGSIVLGEQNLGEDAVTVESGSKVNLIVTPEKEQIISRISVNGEEQAITEENENKFAGEITVNRDTEIVVTFVPVTYKVVVQYNKNGTVTTTPEFGDVQVVEDGVECEAGSVTVDSGSKLKLTAKPNENYRVRQVQINGVSSDKIEGKNDEAFEDAFTVDQDVTFVITFAPNQFEVTFDESAEHIKTHSLSTGDSKVDYDATVGAVVETEDGYLISNVTVTDRDGKEVEGVAISFDNPNYSFSVEHVSSDLVIHLVVEELPDATLDGVVFDKTNVVRESDANSRTVYVLKKDTTMRVAPQNSSANPHISCNGEDDGWFDKVESYTFKSMKINSLRLSYINRWGREYYNENLLKNGNVIYILADDKAPNVTLTLPKLDGGRTQYSSDTAVAVSITDPLLTYDRSSIENAYAGLAKVEYWVSCDGKPTQGSASEPILLFQSNDLNRYPQTFASGDKMVVDTSNGMNNGSVSVTVRATDAAGNVTTETAELQINTVKPSVSVSVSGQRSDKALAPYYNVERTATVTVTDRADSFDQNKVSLFQLDEEGREQPLAASVSWNGQTASVVFNREGSYKWGVRYTNNAGSSCVGAADSESADPFEFIYDKTAPAAVMKVDQSLVAAFISKVTFGLFKTESAAVAVDEESLEEPVQEILYYKDSAHQDLTLKELNDVYASGGFTADACTVDPDEAAVVYARLTDNAGNVTYVNTNGIIVDATKPVITFSVEKSNENGFHSKDVKVGVNILEAAKDSDAYSGLKSASWRVYYVKNGKQQQTASGTFDVSQAEYNRDGSPNTPYSGLQRVLDEEVVIRTKDNNFDNVYLEVTAADNAGNQSVAVTDAININTTQPKVTLSFDVNDEAENAEPGYFNQVRTATIQITDRSSTFDPDGFVLTQFSAKNAAGKDVVTKEAFANMIAGLTWDHQGDVHTLKIPFDADANYQWGFTYTNKAGLQAEAAQIVKPSTDRDHPYAFTVDQTKPVLVEMKAGEKSLAEKIWNGIIWVISFGQYDPGKEIVMKVTTDDATSLPTTVEYYKTAAEIAADDNEALVSELSRKDFKPYSANDGIRIEQNEQAFIYLRITDAAGNVSYVNADGIIVDSTPSEITGPVEDDETIDCGSDSMNETGEGIVVPVTVTEIAPFSGVRKVTYQVQSKANKDDDWQVTQSGVKYEHDKTTPRQSVVPVEIVVDPNLNNRCYVQVLVTAVDYAGNKSTKTINLDIDITAPTIQVQFDGKANSKAAAAEGYYTERTATVTITERSHHFDPDAAADGIAITAKNALGEDVNVDFSIDWTHRPDKGTPAVDPDPNVEGDTGTPAVPADPDKDTHTAVITFKTDANYTFDISYTDKAGNANKGVSYTGENCNQFTVDNSKPTATLTAAVAENPDAPNRWSEPVLGEDVTFGIWSAKSIAVQQTSSDDTSPIKSVEYYKLQAAEAKKLTAGYTMEQIEKISGWEPYPADGLTLAEDQQCIVYLKVTDKAENVSYFSTDGLIVDHNHPQEVVAPVVTVTPVQQPINGIYNADFEVKIDVKDPEVGGTYSGLKEVRYEVYNRSSAEPNKPTQTGTLFKFDKASPRQSELEQTFSGTIKVEAGKNNSNDVQIVVYAVDNAGNAANNRSDNAVHVKVDTTPPRINVSYDNNSADSGTYFKASRTATIRITERNFDPNDVVLTLTSSAGSAPQLVGWSETAGRQPNGDDTVHTATILFAADADYTFDIACTDDAGNKAPKAEFAQNTVAANAFTVDNIDPKVTVSYDNTSAQNGNYYKANRTATIVINEHNFDPGRVAISLAATNDGAAAAVPAVSTWRSNGDTHTATISYTADARYTFDIKVTDKAGRVFDAYNEDVFFVDKTAPKLEITGVQNNSANRDDIIPVVTYSDTNWDPNRVTITLEGAERGDVKLDGGYQDIHNGRRFVFNNFPAEKEVDDIYTLTATLTDKAGNTTTQTIRFSANRFGSAYEMNEATKALNGTYVRHADDVVMTEVNPDELQNIRLTLFKNNKSTVLKEGRDYSVEQTGGNGEWYQYVYTVFNKNFEDGGVYRITFHSEDAAGNVAENTLETKEAELSFGIDRVDPTVSVLNLESKKTYNLEKMKVNLIANDDLKLASVVIYLDGREYITLSEDELDEMVRSGGNYSFDINGDSTDAHELRIVATDAAGNQYVEEVNDFYVTTNLWVRYHNNKPLFYGSILGLLVIGASGIFFIVAKRRKEDEEEEQTIAVRK